jgi:hypothetical protein
MLPAKAILETPRANRCKYADRTALGPGIPPFAHTVAHELEEAGVN